MRLTISQIRFVALLALTMAAAAPTSAGSQIVLDGSVGPAGPIAGPSYLIPESVGQRTGDNLFHSFDSFNVKG